MTTIFVDIVNNLAQRVEERHIPPSPVTPVLPPFEQPEPDGEDLGHAEGQTFVIEYVGGSGERSTRSITVLSIKQGAGGVPMLFAKCHLRNTTRSFRIDRIVSCIDFDGEVHEDVPAFLMENFSISGEAATRRANDDDSKNWSRFRSAHTPHLVILTALSHADAQTLPEEIDEIVQFCAEEAERMGIHTTDAFCRSAAGFVGRLRPSRWHINGALEQLTEEDPETIVRVLRAALRVIDADGRRHPDERKMINLIAEELIGTPVLSEF